MNSRIGMKQRVERETKDGLYRIQVDVRLVKQISPSERIAFRDCDGEGTRNRVRPRSLLFKRIV
jgi:hypothetical protein